jgi:5'-3' exonuclease
MALCRQLCAALGVAHFGSTEYEADDIVGSLAYKAREHGKCAVIVTRDKDLAQLIGPDDHYWDYIGEQHFAYPQIAQRFGVRPERMADFLALTGDAVDNVPGVPGVGKKTATMLVNRFDSLQELYDNIDHVLKMKLRNPGFVTGQLRDYKEAVFLSRQLTGIACDMPLDVSLESLARRVPQLDVLNAFYDGVGFGRLLRNQAERIVENYRSGVSAVAA